MSPNINNGSPQIYNGSPKIDEMSTKIFKGSPKIDNMSQEIKTTGKKKLQRVTPNQQLLTQKFNWSPKSTTIHQKSTMGHPKLTMSHPKSTYKLHWVPKYQQRIQ